VKRRLLLLLVAALLGLGPAVPAATAQDGGDNTAVAINTKDGSSLFRFAFKIRVVAGDVVDQTNAAVAYASCEMCRTVAIAVQIVLVMGTPSVVTPTNLALALNENCTLCETLASAYQFVLGEGYPVRFTAQGRRQLAKIRKALRRLGKSDLTIVEIQARVDELMNSVREILATELVPVRPGEDEEPDDGESTEETTPETTPPTSPTETATTGGETSVSTPPEETTPPTTDTTETAPATTETAPADTTTTDTTTATTTP
jgi:putative peptide zinc metalloprotease protein